MGSPQRKRLLRYQSNWSLTQIRGCYTFAWREFMRHWRRVNSMSLPAGKPKTNFLSW